MKTKKNAAAQQAATTTATEKKNSAKRTVKNNSKKAAEKKTAAEIEWEEENNALQASRKEAAKKHAAAKKAAKKAAETRRAKKAEEARQMEEERRRIEAEAAARRKAEAKKEKEEAREERKTDAATWTAARKEVKEARTPLYYMHNLNRLATGKSDSRPDGLNMTALLHCYNQLQELTETANRREGFSYNAVKVDSRGHICKMVTAPADIEIISYSAGTIRVNTRTAQDIDMIDTYAGYYCLIPVKVDEIGILTAAQSVVMYYNDVARDSRNRYRTTTTRQEIREATQRRHRNAMKLQSEKLERETMKEAARAAREAAEADTTTAAVELQPTQTATQRRRWWHNIAASLF